MSCRRGIAIVVATLVATPLTPPVPVLALQVPGTPAATPISHEPVTCMVADQHPQLRAAVPSGTRVDTARAYFHSALGSDFFYVEGRLQDGVYLFSLPRPQIDAGPVTYYIELAPVGRVGEYSAVVVKDRDDCRDRVIAPFGPAPAAVFGPGGVMGVPAGFAGAVGGATAGGISTGLIIAGAAAIIGATVLVLGGDDPPASPSR